MLAGRQRDVAGITEEQYNAGWEFAKLVRRHASLMGIPLGSPRAAGFEMVSGGQVNMPEPDEDVIIKTRRQYNDC